MGVIVVGDGVIGLSITYALAQNGIEVVLLTNHQSDKKKAPGSNADRLFALSLFSCDFFYSYGFALDFDSMSQAISRILVMDGKSRHVLDLTPSCVYQNKFGYMISEQVLRQHLFSIVQGCKNVRYITAEIVHTSSDQYFRYITLNDGCILRAELVLVADGKKSKLRNLLGIETVVKDYNQTAISCDVQHSEPHHGVAIEKFMPSGPFAILPKTGGNISSIVWTEATSIVQNVFLEDSTLLRHLIQERFYKPFGEVEAFSIPKAFPLSLCYAKQFYVDRAVLVGDSLHSIHPLAGQGLNLGLRDVDTIVRIISKRVMLGLDIGVENTLQEYKKVRALDIMVMMEVTDKINLVFLNTMLGMKTFRKLGLELVNHCSWLRNAFVKYAVGYMTFSDSK